MLPEDASAVADLTSQLGYPASETAIRRRHALIRDRPDAGLFIAEAVGGTAVGWIHVQVVDLLESDRRAEIWGLVVAEAARGTGAGRLLVEAAEQWALARGIDLMTLRSNIKRTQAQGFYEHLGYIVIKTQNAYRKRLT